MTRGKIVLVRFPFDDFSATKVRPALCLTNPVGQYRYVVLAFITSRFPVELQDSDVVFRSDHPEFSLTGLRVTSAIRLHRVVTVRTSLILRELGILPRDIQTVVASRLLGLFELNRD